MLKTAAYDDDEESDVFEGNGLVEAISLMKLDPLLGSSSSNANTSSNRQQKVDESVESFNLNFDSAYSVFKQREDDGFYERIFLNGNCGSESKVSKCSLLKRYQLLRKELSMIEEELRDDSESSTSQIAPLESMKDFDNDFVSILTKNESEKVIGEQESSGNINSSISEDQRIYEFDRRLANIEKTVMGTHNSDGLMAWLTEDLTQDKTLMAVADKLKQQSLILNCTDAVKSESVQSFLNELSKSTAKTSIVDALEGEKMNTLIELIKKFESMSDLIPHLIDRLNTLQRIHERASNFDELITSLELEQLSVKSTLETVSENVKNMEDTMINNLLVYQNKMSDLTKAITDKLSQN